MSSVHKYKVKIKNLDSLKAILEAKGISYRENCTVKQYGRNQFKAELAFSLPGWQYEVGVNAEGEILYDHWGSDYDSFHHMEDVVGEYNEKVITDEAWSFANSVTTCFNEEKEKQIVIEF